MSRIPSVLLVGTGEYTTGFVGGGVSGSDKKVGVVGLSMFYLRTQGKIGRILMAGTNGTKFPGIRAHFEKNIKQVFKNVQDVSFESFPSDTTKSEPAAYLHAMDTLQKGDLVTIFTPDDTHFEIAKAAVSRGLHVLVTKPSVKTFEEHKELLALAKANNAMVLVELHKRWDAVYSDARSHIQTLGDFSYFNSYMSQPKFQLETFRGWLGGSTASSDINYYLNSHHIDFHCWTMRTKARPIRILASASTGVASGEPYKYKTEDSITLMVQWENLPSKNIGTAIYTASWTSPKSDVHSQQRFHYLGHGGEISVDQAHRGYTLATDDQGFKSTNPFYFRISPDANGNFAAQNGYGFLSIEAFVNAGIALNGNGADGKPKRASDFDSDAILATLDSTQILTALLHGGRKSLDAGGRPCVIKYASETDTTPIALSIE